VTVDLTPLSPALQAQLREPNRLIWCLRQASEHTPARLTWTGRNHPAACPFDHVSVLRCPAAEPTTLF
jgi:hypothetical protein